jgi:ribosomal protein S18
MPLLLLSLDLAPAAALADVTTVAVPGAGDPRAEKSAVFASTAWWKSMEVDYKNTTILRNFITERGKIISARSLGNCSKHHRMLTAAVKRARNLALLPFAVV